MEKIFGYELRHNGMDVEYFNSMEEAEEYINKVIKEERVPIKKIFDRKIKLSTGDGYTNYTRVVRYRYITLYERIFTIDYSE